MNRDYKKIFWGLILLLININFTFNNLVFEFIPKFICFIIIYNGVRGLYEEVNGEYFYKAIKISQLMIVVTLVKWIVYILGIMKVSYIIGNVSIWGSVTDLLLQVGVLIIIYNILKEIYLCYEKKELVGYMKKLKNGWNFYFIVSLLTYIVQAFVINRGDFSISVMSILAIIYVISYFLVIFEIKAAGEQL